MKGRVKHWKPGIPTEPSTTLGAIVSKVQFDRVIGYIDSARNEGARLVSGGGRPDDPRLAKGLFIEPTVFADVTPSMRIFKEEIFGPVVGVIKWSDEAAMFEQVNSVDYGLTASIWTNDLTTAHRAAAEIEAGSIWINDISKHFIGAPFGGTSGPASIARNVLRS